MRSRVEMSRSRRLALTGLFAAAAFALSYLERLIPTGVFGALPGVRLGLGNIAVLLAFSLLGRAEGAAVAAAKVILSALLFGSPAAALFSFFGTLLSFAALVICSLLPKESVSYIGASSASAAAHATGQIIAAALMTGSFSVLYYYPALTLFSLAAGILSGALINAVMCRVKTETVRKREGEETQ